MKQDADSQATLRFAARSLLGTSDVAQYEPCIALSSGRAALLSLQGRRCLLVQTTPLRADDPQEAGRRSEIQLCELSSEQVLLPVGMGQGFRMEDLVLLELRGPDAALGGLQEFWRRRLSSATQLQELPADSISLRAVFAEPGPMPSSQHKLYTAGPS